MKRGRKSVWPPRVLVRRGKEFVKLPLGDGRYREVTLGEAGSAAARQEYARIVAEAATGGVMTQPVASVTCKEAVVLHLESRQEEEFRSRARRRKGLQAVIDLYGHRPLAEFGPLAFQSTRRHLAKGGDYSRNYLNALANCIRSWLRWCASRELIPRGHVELLREVDGLRRADGIGTEREPRQPADPKAVAQTLPRLEPIPADMVRLQLLTGMRPGEVCALLVSMIDREWAVIDGVNVWLARFRKDHKTAYRGHRRDVPIGPQAQELLRPYLDRKQPEEHVFSAKELVMERRKRRRLARKSKVQPSQRDRSRPGVRKNRPFFQTDYYDKLVRRACAAAGVVPWTPHQLRHRVATDVGLDYEFEDVQSVMGHAAPDATAIYLKRLERAAKVMARFG